MAEYSFKLQKGTDRTLVFAFYEKDASGEKVVVDFTGYTGAMQLLAQGQRTPWLTTPWARIA